ncbi:MAG: hypothetical protein BGO90_13850 [Legionella sp. 40-6]|nr:MAG: hypothetical protein BGO90_13850 [Legionella sp. 40-6]
MVVLVIVVFVSLLFCTYFFKKNLRKLMFQISNSIPKTGLSENYHPNKNFKKQSSYNRAFQYQLQAVQIILMLKILILYVARGNQWKQ